MYRLFLIFTIVVVALPTSAQNLLTNAGLEDGVISPWYQSEGSGIEEWNVTSADAHSGTFSATAVGNVHVRQDFAATPVSDISSITFWLKDVDPTGFHLVFLYYDDDTISSTSLFSTTSWAMYDVTAALRTDKNLNGFGLWGYEASNLAEDRTYLDDVQVMAVPEPTSLAVVSLGAIALYRKRKRHLTPQ